MLIWVVRKCSYPKAVIVKGGFKCLIFNVSASILVYDDTTIIEVKIPWKIDLRENLKYSRSLDLEFYLAIISSVMFIL